MFKKFNNFIFSLEKAFYQKSVGSYFDKRNLEKDIQVFQSLHPKDDFERSIAQFKCQVYPFKKDTFILNCMAFFLIPIIMVMLLLKKQILVKDDQSKIVCYNCFNLPGALPEAMQDLDISYLKPSECPYYLSKKDVSFLFRFFFRSFLSPFLSFRVMLKVAKYRAIVDSFSNLEIIAITGEFVDTSSAMTQYCHENGVKHYDFMQGEAFGSPRASFFHFDKCYVWDKYYEDIYVSYGACPEQFEVSLPKGLKRIEGCDTEKSIDYTYYLGGDPTESFPVIRNAIDKLVAKGYVCEVRPHPRWSNMEDIKRMFEGISIQDTDSVNISDSIMKTKNAISLYSTVLNQSYINGVNVVIDDVTYPDKFKKLEEYKYIMLSKPHKLLSEIINS